MFSSSLISNLLDLIGILDIQTVANTKDANAARKLQRCRVFKGISHDFLQFQTKGSVVSPEFLVQCELFDRENKDGYLHCAHDLSNSLREFSGEAEKDSFSDEGDDASYARDTYVSPDGFNSNVFKENRTTCSLLPLLLYRDNHIWRSGSLTYITRTN